MIFNMVSSANSTDNGEALSRKEVNFYDYEGTLLYAYSIEEANALTTLPDAPQHEGLLFQEWNYSLEDIKSTDRPIDVGATYITDDGKTRLYISIPPNSEPDRPPARNIVPLYISQTVSNGVTIDWGDGSSTETLAGTGNVNTTHTYANAGDYVITLEPTDGCILGFGDGVDNNILGNISTCLVYQNMLYSVRIGRLVTHISDWSFYECGSLSSITLPNNIISIGNFAFNSCVSLLGITIPNGITKISEGSFDSCVRLLNISISKSVVNFEYGALKSCFSLSNIVIPNGVTSIGDNALGWCTALSNIIIPDSVTSIGALSFYFCNSLSNIAIPDSVTSIGEEAFGNCASLSAVVISKSLINLAVSLFNSCTCLSSIIIPKSVTSIGEDAFYYCTSMKEYHFKSVVPPQLNNTDAFYDIPQDCIIYVPVGSLNAYQNATNWAAYASQIKEEGT